MRRALGTLTVSVTALVLAATAVATDTVSVHLQRNLTAGHNVHVAFHARRLPEGGYYYAVIVLRPYKKYTRTSPPPCATSSNMQRTDYGYVEHGKVALALTPANSRTGHWCPGGRYLGAIYAVPHSPPCESTYPCRSEPYKQPCVGIGPGCITGVVANPHWLYPGGLPSPRASGAAIVGRFTVAFPAHTTSRPARRSTAPRVR